LRHLMMRLYQPSAAPCRLLWWCGLCWLCRLLLCRLRRLLLCRRRWLLCRLLLRRLLLQRRR
jgi:hypothetical protein